MMVTDINKDTIVPTISTPIIGPMFWIVFCHASDMASPMSNVPVPGVPGPLGEVWMLDCGAA